MAVVAAVLTPTCISAVGYLDAFIFERAVCRPVPTIVTMYGWRLVDQQAMFRSCSYDGVGIQSCKVHSY